MYKNDTKEDCGANPHFVFGIESVGSKGKRLSGEETISYKVSIKNRQGF